MPHDAAFPPAAAIGLRLTPAWRGPLVRLASAWIVLIVFFLHDWLAMARQWWDSSTYNHILLIPAILVWLVWARRQELAHIAPRGWWPGLILFAGVMFLWLLGVFSGLDLARQLAAVAALQASAIMLLGPRASLGLLFPLAYMLFLVPFGDELVPMLQTITAKITIGLTHLSATPAVIDGVFIHTPAGLFEVAESCSGVKFLIAMIALGVLVAQVCFRSWSRRAAFLALCVVVPVLANGVRAWGTIYVAQFKGAEFAVGFDHIVYGWIFFALVMGAILAAAWRYFDRAGDDRFIDGRAIAAMPLPRWVAGWQAGGAAALAAGLATIVVVALWATMAARLSAELPRQIFLPEVAGWQRSESAPEVAWEPLGNGSAHRLLGRYEDKAGHKVDVFYALYDAQDEARDPGGFGQGALTPGGAWSWIRGASMVDGKGEWLLAHGHVERFAATYYRSGSLLTGSNLRLKLAAMRDRLLLREHPAMLLILSAQSEGGTSGDASVAAFRRSAGPLDAWMDRIAETD
ncbi:MAG: exosortase A [Novosphingobium sp.]|nr:exosortase A [Novosphingobium sp.]